jgi:hypothetical protein
MSASKSTPPPTMSEIVGGLATDVQDLVRGEIALARTEFDRKLHHFILAAVWLMGGALVGFAGLVVLLEAAAAALALVIPVWAASLIIGLVVIAVGAALARSGLGMLSLQELSPDRTAANIQKDAQMLREHT